MYFEIYKQGNSLLGGKWRWRLRAANHKIIAESGEAYFNKDDCLAGLDLVKCTDFFTPIKEVTNA